MTSFVAAFLARVSPLVFFMASAMAPDRWQKFSESGNISYLYTLDTFDLTIISLYFGLLAILSIYGIYRIRMTYLYWRYRDHSPKPARLYSEDELPKVTIQLPLFNEMYVVERLLESAAPWKGAPVLRGRSGHSRPVWLLQCGSLHIPSLPGHREKEPPPNRGRLAAPVFRVRCGSAGFSA